MITIKLQGGLGNQMFQYALGLKLQSLGRKVVYDHSRVFLTGDEAVHDRNKPFYGLDGFGTNVEFGPLQPKHYREPDLGFHPEVFDLDDVTLDGYWQNEAYFPDPQILVKQFQPVTPINHPKMIDEISDPENVVVQVRRGDYLAFKDFHGVMDELYFVQGVQFTEGKKAFIFTDDEPWCREKFPKATIANTGSRHWDIFLMSEASKIVISNSTFGWWGAWLGDHNPFRTPDRMVIAPERWFNKMSSFGIVPDRWKQI